MFDDEAIGNVAMLVWAFPRAVVSKTTNDPWLHTCNQTMKFIISIISINYKD